MSRSKSIVKQATFLAVAGILVRIIGVLYRSPLKAMIGAEGIGYYSTAYTIYALILLISSYSIPTAISKLISEKLAVHQYNNVQKILKCAFIYICAIGGSAAIITFIIAPFIVSKNAVMALRILCPTIFFSGLLGVFRGYFQAYQTTIYTSISQIIEQIFNAIVSVLAAYIFIQPYLNTEGSALASHGAAGSALGTGAGVIVGLLFMIVMYFLKKNTLEEKVDPDLHEDSYKDIFSMILHIVTPIIIATCVYNLVTFIDMYIYYFAMDMANMSKAAQAVNYGIYNGEYIVLQNVPVALASAMSTASIPAISTAFATNDLQKTKEHIKSGIQITMLILIPAAVGMAVLSYPILGLIFPQKETISISSTCLTIGSPAIVFYGLSTLSNGMLQALGKVNVPLVNAAKALVYHVIIVIVLLFITPLGVYSLVIGNCLYALLVCVMNQRALRKTLHYKQEIRRTYVLPIIASAIMGVIVYLIYKLLFTLTRSVFIPLVISIIIGVIVYFVIILFMYSDHPEELESIPYVSKLINKLKR
jgi:stage V sporulation protein B